MLKWNEKDKVYSLRVFYLKRKTAFSITYNEVGSLFSTTLHLN